MTGNPRPDGRRPHRVRHRAGGDGQPPTPDRPREPGTLAREVIRLHNDGRTVHEISGILREHPRNVRAIIRDYYGDLWQPHWEQDI
jgi:hypothetical protein